MRIIAGKHKGRALITPKGQNTRPTADRARESVFNVLAHAEWAQPLNGARVMDLFAGSGSLGFEALSRGASFALFVETDNTARGAIRQNIEMMGLFGETRLHRRSAISLGLRPPQLGPPFDLAFLDPPYQRGLVTPTLRELVEGCWLTPMATIMVETSSDETLELEGFDILDTREKGAARITFLKQT